MRETVLINKGISKSLSLRGSMAHSTREFSFLSRRSTPSVLKSENDYMGEKNQMWVPETLAGWHASLEPTVGTLFQQGTKVCGA
jgi:hypothetical protein